MPLALGSILIALALGVGAWRLSDSADTGAQARETAPGSSSTPGQPGIPDSSGEPAVTDPPKRPASRPPLVVLISVDGLNTDAVRQLRDQGRVPALTRLFAEGAGTLNARTSFEETRTLPNHTGILTGRAVSGPTGTRVTFNEDNGGTLEALTGGYIPGVFDLVHDRSMPTTFLAEKDKFNFLIRSWDASHGARDQVGRDDGRGKLGLARVAGSSTLERNLIRQLADRPARLSFLHVAAPDLAGHAHGFMSPRYLEAVVAADAEVGRVLDVIRTDAGLRRRTTVILTADHGGRGPNHGDPTRIDNYRIPFVVWGRGVARGADLYAVNPGRRDPGTRRPGYAGPQPIRNLDAANLALSLLRLSALPDTTLPGVPVLRVR